MVTLHTHWSDVQTVVATQRLLSGAMTTGVLDLTRAESARLFIAVGKGGSVQPSTAVNIQVRPMYAAGALQTVGGAGVAPVFEVAAERTATINSTVTSAAATSGAYAYSCKVRTGLAAGQTVCIAPSNVARTEWARVHHTRPNATASQLVMDSPLMFTHSVANADKVFNNAQSWIATVAGGTKYKVIFRHPGTAGSPQTVRCVAQVQQGDIESG